jgi:hypothetical protein
MLIGLSKPYELFSKQTLKDKVSIKVFRLNSKKEVSKKELKQGLVFCCEVDRDNLDRIEISSKENSLISVVVEQTDNPEVKLRIDHVYLSEYNNKVTFHIFPWVSCVNSGGNHMIKIYEGEELISEFGFYLGGTCD